MYKRATKRKLQESRFFSPLYRKRRTRQKDRKIVEEKRYERETILSTRQCISERRLFDEKSKRTESAAFS